MKHEGDPFVARPILVGLWAMVVLLVLGWAIPTWMQSEMEERRVAKLPPASPLTEAYGRVLPPAPRLQVNPDRDIEQLREAERERLTTYGWVDRTAGIAHIPVERAMLLVAERATAGAKGATP